MDIAVRPTRSDMPRRTGIINNTSTCPRHHVLSLPSYSQSHLPRLVPVPWRYLGLRKVTNNYYIHVIRHTTVTVQPVVSNRTYLNTTSI
jgi:hypothetical protein